MAIHFIFEIANVHEGRKEKILSLIKEFEKYDSSFSPALDFGMKFQPFHFDRIALPDFEWYPVYKELYFTPEEWKEIIREAAKTKKIWIDVFDTYSVQIARENIDLVCGFKLQASVLRNQEVLNELKDSAFNGKKFILNISGFAWDQAQLLLKNWKENISASEWILQVGFQDYPTDFSDMGLSKLNFLSSQEGFALSFADHLSHEDAEAIRLPLIASMMGAQFIEKHVRPSGPLPKYDHFSSISPEMAEELINLLVKYHSVLEQPFQNEREKIYLDKTRQAPVLNKDISAGNLISPERDFIFRRTSQKGLDYDTVMSLIRNYNVLGKEKKNNETFQEGDFRKASIAAIIACRMKSTRLAKKAILKIGDKSSIELCISNAMRFTNVNHFVLATSTLEEDQVLKDHTWNPKVIFHTGDPEDVIRRYIGIIDKEQFDVFVRITGDMPYVSDEILQILLKSHFEKGADYTTGVKAAVGTNLEIINSNALRKVSAFFPSANYSEYMTYYFQNNPDYFRLNFVDLPPELIRDYRLTLDYPEDLELFNKIESHFSENNLLYSLRAIFKLLDENPELAKINKDCTLKYLTDPELIATLKRVTTIPAGTPGTL